MAGSRDEMRASDADRAAAGEVLRAALDEGRLDFHEYDERLRDAYTAKTYGELNRLMADLPIGTPAPASAAQVVPLDSAAPATKPAPDPTRPWLRGVWENYLFVVGICVVIWVAAAAVTGTWYFWPIWVAGPWGLVLLMHSVSGVRRGEPQRWASKRARKAERRARKRARYAGYEGGD